MSTARKTIYEVKKDGVLKMSTTSIEAFYTKDIREKMRKSGYKLYENGKIFKENGKMKG